MLINLFSRIIPGLRAPSGRRANLITGRRGEKAAVKYLRRRGWMILFTNWKYREAEIDIVAICGRSLVFLEVKTRRAGLSEGFDPVEAVDQAKQRKIIRASDYFMWKYARLLRKHGVKRCRYDIIALTCRRGSPFFARFKLEHRPAAFVQR